MPAAKERSFTLLWAALWSVAAGAALYSLRRGFARVLPGTRTDLVTQAALTAIVLLLVCYGVLQLYAAERPVQKALGIRPSPPSLTALGLGLGGVLPFATSSLASLVESRFPSSEEAKVVNALLLSTSTLPRSIGLVVALSIVLPLVNELCFRGAVFGALRRSASLGVATFGAALTSVLAELDLRRWPELVVLGIFASHVRAASGSLLPAVALHVGYGTVTTIAALSGVMPLGAGAGVGGTLAGWLGVAVLAYVVQAVARSSEDASDARAEDASS